MVPSVMIKMIIPLSKSVATCLPFGVCCCFRLSVSYHLRRCSIRQTRNIRQRDPLIHLPWCDFLYLGALLSYPQFPSLPTSFGRADADGAYRDICRQVPGGSLWFVGSFCCCDNRFMRTIDPSSKALLSYPQFPSLQPPLELQLNMLSVCFLSPHLCPCCVPSDRVQLLPIHVSFGCDTS